MDNGGFQYYYIGSIKYEKGGKETGGGKLGNVRLCEYRHVASPL